MQAMHASEKTVSFNDKGKTTHLFFIEKGNIIIKLEQAISEFARASASKRG